MTMHDRMDGTAPSAAMARGAGWRLRLNVGDGKWWIWAVLSALLLMGVAGVEHARSAAMAVAGLQAAAWLARSRSVAHFPTQVRAAYAVWMAASFIPVLTPMFWIQAAGTTMLVLVGYCPLARMLLFLPANRTVPLTLARAARIVLHPPTAGSVLSDLKL